MLEIVPTEIPEVKLLTPRVFGDSRGSFSETYHKDRFAKAGITLDFVQDNESISRKRGTVRGLHFQCPPYDQAKLVRVIRGRILDVAIDIRKSSAGYGRWVTRELSADNKHQLLIPSGFAHGFCTLEADTIVHYKVTSYYSLEHEFGIRWNDADLGIAWPVTDADVTISDKDRGLPPFKSMQSCFP